MVKEFGDVAVRNQDMKETNIGSHLRFLQPLVGHILVSSRHLLVTVGLRPKVEIRKKKKEKLRPGEPKVGHRR